MMDDGIAAKLHKIQAKQIIDSVSSVSFSRVVNEILEKGLNNK